MLVPLIVTPLNDLPRMRLVLLNGGICQQTNVVMDVKVEQRPRFSSCFVDNEIVERVMLSS